MSGGQDVGDPPRGLSSVHPRTDANVSRYWERSTVAIASVCKCVCTYVKERETEAERQIVESQSMSEIPLLFAWGKLQRNSPASQGSHGGVYLHCKQTLLSLQDSLGWTEPLRLYGGEELSTSCFPLLLPLATTHTQARYFSSWAAPADSTLDVL